MVNVVIVALGAAIGGILILLLELFFGSAPIAVSTESTYTMPRENEAPMDGERMSAEYNPTILGPQFDDHIDSVAAGYVIHTDNQSALYHLTDRIRRRLRSETEHLSREELAGRVEWWVRNNYQHLPEP